MRYVRFLIFFIPAFVVVDATISAYEPCESNSCSNARATTTDLRNIVIRIYNRALNGDHQNALIGNAMDLFDNLDLGRSTVLYVHGWRENCDIEDGSSIGVAKAYLKRGDHNIILINYPNIANRDYVNAVNSAKGIGYTIAKMLDEFVKAGLDPDRLHIVGHSLGAQIAGFIGAYTSFKLARITGLDPAGPLFEFSEERLTANAAKFVDVIHTDAGVFGCNYKTGTVDYYPNGGTAAQPGCFQDLIRLEDYLISACGHAKSWKYFAESVVNEDAFLALPCISIKNWFSASNLPRETVTMGYGASPSTPEGSYCLATNEASPYGKGRSGARSQMSIL